MPDLLIGNDLPLERQLGGLKCEVVFRKTKTAPAGTILKIKGFIEVTVLNTTERTLINTSHIKEVIKCNEDGEAFIVLFTDLKKRNCRLRRIGLYVSESYDWILNKIREAVEE